MKMPDLLPHLHVWSFVAQLLTAKVELAPLLLLLPVHLHAVCCCAVCNNTGKLQRIRSKGTATSSQAKSEAVAF
jgi:hypothetical protein